MADRVGQTLGKYRLTRLLGQGGFAEVYLGVHLYLGTQAAIKLLHTLLATSGEIEKFRQEAQIIAALVHPHIVRVLDFDVEEGTPYLVLDYAPNGSLRSRLPAGTAHDPRVVLPYLAQVAEGLHYAHDQKLVHRDIKPENMLLGRQNEALLGDFGIAIVAQNTSLQKTQGVAGTTAYMAPEQLQGKPRPASDLYSLGVVVYEWLTGERPFQGAPMEVASQHVLAPPPPLREKVPTLPAALEQVVLTALAKDPKDRFGSARAFANAFTQACETSFSSATLSTLAGPGQPTGNQPVILSNSQSGDAIYSATTHITPLVPPALPGSQSEDAIYSATTHITPTIPPALSNPQLPAGQSGPSGPSLFDAQTQLKPPMAVTSPAQVSAGSITGPTVTGSGPSVPPGWANQITPASGPVPAVTWEPSPAGSPSVAWKISRGDEDTFADPVVPPLALPRENEKARRRGGARRWVLAIAASILALALFGAAYAFTHLPGPGPTAANAATVAITPQSSDLKDTFTIPGVASPDASKQVGTRPLSAPTPAHSTTVNATGQGTTPGTQAQTIFDVYSNMTTYLNIAAGASYPNMGCAGSITIVLDASVSVAPSIGVTYNVPGHIAEVGPVNVSGCFQPIQYTAGNCGGKACVFINAHIVDHFTNGTNPQTYTVVQQSDIDGAANSLIQANQPNAELLLQGQLQSGEQLIGTQQCAPNVSPNHRAGDQASSVTVSVTFTCTGEAYDQAGALTLAKTLLTSEAQSKLGAGYALVGQIKASLVNATQDAQGNVTILVNAEGVWAYQFSDSQKQALASLIAGKSQQEALSLLAAQTGVAQASIQIQGGNGQTLPPDPQKITLMIQPVSGL